LTGRVLYQFKDSSHQVEIEETISFLAAVWLLNDNIIGLISEVAER